ncbi:MAG: hypothetical protein LBI96_01830, partial [Odoribacteraceae bacterium]|nr:hypothetical protein [Odoribacteraceae bacterium]
MKKTIYALLAALAFVGCENEEYLYRDISARLWLGERYTSGNMTYTRDSTTLSFMMLDADIMEDTLYITANVTGDRAPVPRPFTLVIIED